MATSPPEPGGRRPVLTGLAVVAVLGQLFGLYRVAGPPTPPWFPHADKLEHALGFALPVALVLLAHAVHVAGRGARPARRAQALVVAAFLAHGVVSELVQHAFYATRTGDPLDVLADWTGTALGAATAWALLRDRGPSGAGLDSSAGRAPSRAR
jgi:VanZ family protein